MIFIKKYNKVVANWVTLHYVNLAIFNTALVILVLLHTAKYFDPFWLVSINIIVLISLAMCIFLLGARSVAMFWITCFFWIVAGLMQILGIFVWAERISIYVFQSLTFGVLLLFFEYFSIYNKKKVYGKN